MKYALCLLAHVDGLLYACNKIYECMTKPKLAHHTETVLDKAAGGCVCVTPPYCPESSDHPCSHPNMVEEPQAGVLLLLVIDSIFLQPSTSQ